MKKNVFITFAAWLLLLYGLIEIVDSITVVLMSLGFIGNPYPDAFFQPVDRMIKENSSYLIPLFFSIAGLRILSAIGLFKNRAWGFYSALCIIFITYIWVPFMLPLSIFDFSACSLILIFLIFGKYGKKELSNA